MNPWTVVLALCFTAALVEGSPRIINGEDAKAGEFPFIVSLKRFSTQNHSCAATILTPSAVLTAGHCCVDQDKFVFAGSHLLNGVGVKVRATRYVIHEEYNPEAFFMNDICVAFLEEDLTFSDLIQPVTLPPRDLVINDGDLQTLVGWGVMEVGGSDVSNALQVGRGYQGLSMETCNGVMGTEVHPGTLCAKGGDPSHAACSGDSGSPLLSVDGVQTGIENFVVTPCATGFPDFYSRVSFYIDWIEEKLGADAKLLRFAQSSHSSQ